MKYFRPLIYCSTLLLLSNCTTTDIPVPVTAPIVETITYDDDVKTIIDTNCVRCHGSVSPSAGLNLTTYSLVRSAAENRGLIARMNDSSNPMPQDTGKLPQATLDIIDKWKTDGFLEN